MLIGNLIPWRSKVREREAHEGVESPLTRFHSEVDRLFDRFFGEAWPSPWTGDAWMTGWAPSLDVSERDDAIVVRAEVPGVDPKELDISVTGEVLVLSGEKREEKEERNGGHYYAERRFGSFRRAVPLPAAIDQEKISAEYDRGILTITLPKSEKAAAKRIPVSVSKK